MNHSTPTGTEAGFDLDKLEALLNATTQGEWLRVDRTVYSLEPDGWRKGVEQFRNRFSCSISRDGSGAPEDELIANAEFIVVAKNALPALIALARRAAPDSAAQPDTTASASGLLSSDELAAFHRFCECAEDFDSGGHDVDKDMMVKLARIGVVRSTGFGRHETTAFGDKIRAAQPVQAAGAVDERALFEHAERASDLTRDEDVPDDYANPYVQSAWEGWKARASLAPVSAKSAPDWHAAVLAECMRIEAAYKADDPVATLKALIDYYANGSDIAVTNKVLADNYLRATCGTPVSAQQGAAKSMDEALEVERADFEDWYLARYSEPLQSRECARQWSTWLARSTGTYKARGGWKISPQPWGPYDAFPAGRSAPAAAVRAAERVDAMHKGVVGALAEIKAEHLAAKAPAAQAVDAKPPQVLPVVVGMLVARWFINKHPSPAADSDLFMGFAQDVVNAVYGAASPASTPEAAQADDLAYLIEYLPTAALRDEAKRKITALTSAHAQQAAARAEPIYLLWMHGWPGAWEEVSKSKFDAHDGTKRKLYIAAPTAGAAETGGDAQDNVRLVLDEVERATRKFPTWPTDPLHAVAVLGEEFGELTKAVLQTSYEPHKVKEGELRTEAIQTAAMALRFVASLERYEFVKCDQHEQPAMRATQQEGS